MNDLKPKECCNRNCKEIFYVPAHKFFMVDICKKCQDKQHQNKEVKNAKHTNA